MSPALLLAAWMAVGLGLGWRHRPSPARLRRLAPASQPATRAGEVPAPSLAARAGALTQSLGVAVLRRTGRPATPEAGRRLGAALVAGALALPVLPAAVVPVAVTVWALPGMAARRRASRRKAAVAADLPDVVDLLVLAVGAGLTVRLAVAAVARRSAGPLGAELARAGQEADLGRRLADALDDIPERAGDATRPLVAALIASERYGAPLGAGLERLAHEVRADRRRRAEEAARKVPVKLIFPLVSCTLPAFGLLTVAPLIVSAVRSLRL